MAAMDELCRLVSDNELDAAGQLAREQWAQITNIDRTQREALLVSLSPGEHSLVWIAVMTMEIKQFDLEWATLVRRMASFATNFTPEQVRLHPNAFCELIHQYTDLLCVNRKAILGIAAVRDAVRRYPPTDQTLTAIHSDLIQLCLAAKCVKPCLPFLEIDFTTLSTERSQLDSKHVVLFYYYGGMVYTCLHDYLKALQMFTMCLCVPSIAVSAVMLAAYRKYILVCLLKYGKLVPLPQCSAHLVEKVFKNPCAPYLELARSYSAREHTTVRQLVTGFSESFVTEGNYGLVNRVVSQLVRHSVQRLTMSFLTLPLEDAAHRVDLSGSSEMEKMLRDMIEDGEINASISQQGGMVVFSDEGDQRDVTDSSRIEILEKRLQECIALQNELSKANSQLALDPRFVQKSGHGGIGLEDDPLSEDHLM